MQHYGGKQDEISSIQYTSAMYEAIGIITCHKVTSRLVIRAIDSLLLLRIMATFISQVVCMHSRGKVTQLTNSAWRIHLQFKHCRTCSNRSSCDNVITESELPCFCGLQYTCA